MGKLYKTLHNIEVARQNAVRNAKMANLPVNDDMSLLALSDLYRYQNNTEEVLPEQTVEEQDYGLWEQPPEWPDLKEILSNESPVVYKDVEYTPMFAIILDARLPFKTRFGDSYILLKTSDGQVLLNSEWTNNTELPWDKTKDIKCSDGHIVRWMIVYKKTDLFTPPYSLQSFNMKQQPVLAITYGAYTFSHPGQWCETSASSNAKYNNNLMVVDTLPGCEFTKFDNYFQQCANLRKFHYPVTPGLTTTSVPSAIGYSKFYATYYLQEFSVPGLKQWGSPLATTSGSSDINDQRCLQHVNLPDLEQTTAYFIKRVCPGSSDMAPLLTFNTPKLKVAWYCPICYSNQANNPVDIVDNSIEQLTKGLLPSTYTWNIKSITMTNLKTIICAGASLADFKEPNVRVNLPALTDITFAGPNNYAYLFDVNVSNNVVRKGNKGFFASLPSLTTINGPENTALISCYGVDATIDMASIEEINLKAFVYNTISNLYNPLLKLITPNLKKVHVNSINSTGSGYCDTILQLVHDEKIDFTLDNLTKSSLTRYYNGFIIDDKIHHFTLTNPTYVHCLGEVLCKTHIDKLTCLVNDYINSSTKWLESTMYYQTVLKIFLQDNIELDLQSTSSFDKAVGQVMSEEQFAKLFTNLITLPEGETRTLILGDNLTKLSEETKAIATSKGWVLE